MPENTEVDKYLEKMKKDDDKFHEELEASIEELKDMFDIDDRNLHKEFMRVCGNMQRYCDKKARYEKELVKIKRFRDKLYNDRYEELKLHGTVALKSQHEYDVWISKSSNYIRVCSYCDTLKVLISHCADAAANLRQLGFILQSMVKNRELEGGPTF